jgi:hypothetical protein
MRFLIFLIFVSLTGNLVAQEKKAEKKPAATKKAEPKKAAPKKAEPKKAEAKKAAPKKAAEPSQDWGRFNTGSKKDLEKIEKDKAAKKK